MALRSAALTSPTVLTAWTGTLLRALDDRRLDSRALAEQAGIPSEVLADPDRRVPLAASTRLWRAAVEATGDDALGIDVSRYVRPTTFHALGQAFLASPTLRAALERTARFSAVTADVAVATTEQTADGFALVIGWRPLTEPPAFEAVDAILASIVRTARFMLDRSVAPVRIALERPAPRSVERFRSFFRCTITFGAAANVIVFDDETVDRAVPGGNPQLARASDGVAAGYLAALRQPTVTNEVRRVVIAILPDGEPTLAAIAHALAISPRTLQRQLAAAGTTFRIVLDDTRKDLACAYLRDTHHSVTELAYLLGFSETAAFSRAFKRWTGTSPSRHLTAPAGQPAASSATAPRRRQA